MLKKTTNLLIAGLFITALTFASSNHNKIPSEETQDFCCEYAINSTGNSYATFGAVYDDCCR